jgi:hypothetical protein
MAFQLIDVMRRVHRHIVFIIHQICEHFSDASDKKLQREGAEDFQIEVAFSDFDLPLQLVAAL